MSRFKIGERIIDQDSPCYIIAEISCNHNGDIEEAKAIIRAAADAKADAVKLQTYRADTISRDFKKAPNVGGMWDGMDMYALYDKAHTPWEWYSVLNEYAREHGLDLFSSPFDETAVDYLVEHNTPVLKVASPEIVDTKLLEEIAQTGLPVIMSNGMSTKEELDRAVKILKDNGTKDLALLHCNSGYPARFDEANLKTIPALGEEFGCIVGLSDHTLFADEENCAQPMAHVTPFEAVKHGAKIIEVHLMLDRADSKALFDKNKGGFDWAFSREPAELAKTIDLIRRFEKGEEPSYETQEEQGAALSTHGKVHFEPTAGEAKNRAYRPSLWVVGPIKAGEKFKFCAGTKEGNFDSIRPADGLDIIHTDEIEGQTAASDIHPGQPLRWDMIKKTS